MKVIFPLLAGMCIGLNIGSVQFAMAQPTNGASDTALVLDLSKLHQQEIELAAQFGLLKDLTAQHRQRAEEASKVNERDKARWEADLARELAERVDRTAAQLEEITRQQLNAKTAGKSADAALRIEPPSRDETAFYIRLDTELWRVEEELKAATESAAALGAQLATNNTPEEMLRVSNQAQENNLFLRYLTRERSELELKKLQYRALKKPQGS